ncbi:MAG TPA: PEP/pyruvate-binding domain-containing protein [Promineifilum sp.]|nr:PEP/pyruvate-binding domain-containing protein [Promineifilum sp.]HRQ12408.1 PEP/pyruvate-binding domain-containing protein [Promineifilum sp.]
MSNFRLRTTTPTIDIYIKLAQYPILADRLRERMRQELFGRGIVNPDKFEQEVHELCIASQKREGLGDPYYEEDSQTWQMRMERIRDYHTDAYFADNVGSVRLEALIAELLNSRSSAPDTVAISFNPEIAPWEMLFRQGEAFERMPPDELERYRHHLEEIKVVLIKRLMSDQLPFIGVAKRVLTIDDLRRIYSGLIGTGKIGGKAAGMYLAWRILQEVDERYGRAAINIPDSYFIGTDVLYEFFLMNKLEHYMNQKYRSVREIRSEYPRIVEDFLASSLPDYLVVQIREVVESLGDSPLIVRSSSLLEDNFGFSFAGKYNSYFCANQGTPEENLAQVLEAIRRVYASSVNPDALLYRKKHDLIDYDERMAILLQRVTGRWHGRYFYPDMAGVGFSENPFCWTPEIRRGEGFLRLVAGMGTRAVDRVAQDYPRLIPLSHPELRPETTVEGQRNFAQRYMEAVDREQNGIVTVPVREALLSNSTTLPLVASIDTGTSMLPIQPDTTIGADDHIVMTFDGLTQDATFIEFMREILQHLEIIYQGPVNLEYSLMVGENGESTSNQRNYQLYILECRPLNERLEPKKKPEPEIDDTKRQLFRMPTLLPSGEVDAIDYLVFVDPESYYDIEDEDQRNQIAETITALNDILPAGRFGLIGPGRWGSLDSRLSVPITYSDICNTSLLVEISPPYTPAPELAYGTEFFEGVRETGILVLGIQPMPRGGSMDWEFLRHSPNLLTHYVPWATDWADCVRVIDLNAAAGSSLRLVIDEETNEAIACFDEPATR